MCFTNESIKFPASTLNNSILSDISSFDDCCMTSLLLFYNHQERTIVNGVTDREARGLGPGEMYPW